MLQSGRRAEQGKLQVLLQSRLLGTLAWSRREMEPAVVVIDGKM